MERGRGGGATAEVKPLNPFSHFSFTATMQQAREKEPPDRGRGELRANVTSTAAKELADDYRDGGWDRSSFRLRESIFGYDRRGYPSIRFQRDGKPPPGEKEKYPLRMPRDRRDPLLPHRPTTRDVNGVLRSPEGFRSKPAVLSSLIFDTAKYYRVGLQETDLHGVCEDALFAPLPPGWKEFVNRRNYQLFLPPVEEGKRPPCPQWRVRSLTSTCLAARATTLTGLRH